MADLVSPYSEIAELVRSELDDNDVTSGYEVENEKMQREIDLAIKLRVGPDLVFDFYETGSLTSDILLTENILALKLTSIETARRIVSGFLQSNTRQNISIRKGSTSINTSPLVDGLRRAVQILKEKYNSEIIGNCEGAGFSA